MTDDWDDLFAMAAGKQSLPAEVPQDTNKQGNLPSPSISKTIRTKKRKRNTADRFREMLDSRISVVVSLPSSCSYASNEKDWLIQMYHYLRKLRIDAMAFVSGKDGEKLDKAQVTDILVRARFPSFLDSGEVTILFEKKNLLLRCLSHTTKTFEETMRIIMACDDLYLRLYYLQVSGALLPAVETLFLPHPISYFGDLSDHLVTTKTKLVQIQKNHANMSKWYGLDEINHHPLTAIHHHRFLETHCLFTSSSLSVSDTKQHLLKALCDKANDSPPHSLEYHSTPATPLLQEWRDSCRDVICHLFCFATVTNSTLQSLVTTLKESSITSLVELGAGTGYLAKLLQHWMEVLPIDIHPTSGSFNEYHGRTHPFTNVHKGTYQTAFKNVNIRNLALLLCYPPPKSDMAHNALREFTSRGGRIFVHIGEWKGMTGSAQFESFLQKNYVCIKRMPCLTWGTDASDVTVWKRKSGTESPSILLPCLQCGTHAATRRCRLLRHAVYCSRTCFELSRPHEFHAMCHFGLVPHDLVLDFDDDLHFRAFP